MADHTQITELTWTDAAFQLLTKDSNKQRSAFTFFFPTDVTSPVVDNFSPPNGSTLAGTDPFFFDVKDETAAFSGIFVYVDPGNGKPEAVYDLEAGSFIGTYASLSTATSIDGGLRFRVRRFEGWVGNVTATIRVIDSGGNKDT